MSERGARLTAIAKRQQVVTDEEFNGVLQGAAWQLYFDFQELPRSEGNPMKRRWNFARALNAISPSSSCLSECVWEVSLVGKAAWS